MRCVVSNDLVHSECTAVVCAAPVHADIEQLKSVRSRTSTKPLACENRRIFRLLLCAAEKYRLRNQVEKRLPGGAKQQAENPSVFAGYKATDLVEDGILGAK